MMMYWMGISNLYVDRKFVILLMDVMIIEWVDCFIVDFSLKLRKIWEKKINMFKEWFLYKVLKINRFVILIDWSDFGMYYLWKCFNIL